MNGKVGIGTATPLAPMHIDSTVTPCIYADAFNQMPSIRFRRINSGSPGVVARNNLMSLGATGHDGTNLSVTNRAVITATAEENWSTTAQGTSFYITTTAPTTVTTTEKFRITGAGNIGNGKIILQMVCRVL